MTSRLEDWIKSDGFAVWEPNRCPSQQLEPVCRYHPDLPEPPESANVPSGKVNYYPVETILDPSSIGHIKMVFLPGGDWSPLAIALANAVNFSLEKNSQGVWHLEANVSPSTNVNGVLLKSWRIEQTVESAYIYDTESPGPEQRTVFKDSLSWKDNKGNYIGDTGWRWAV